MLPLEEFVSRKVCFCGFPREGSLLLKVSCYASGVVGAWFLDFLRGFQAGVAVLDGAVVVRVEDN